jgi:hypothetical protein
MIDGILEHIAGANRSSLTNSNDYGMSRNTTVIRQAAALKKSHLGDIPGTPKTHLRASIDIGRSFLQK